MSLFRLLISRVYDFLNLDAENMDESADPVIKA